MHSLEKQILETGMQVSNWDTGDIDIQLDRRERELKTCLLARSHKDVSKNAPPFPAKEPVSSCILFISCRINLERGSLGKEKDSGLVKLASI